MSETNNTEIVPQQSQQQSSGRGRGRSGRGRGQRVQGRMGQQTYVSDHMQRYINGFSVMANPVINYFIVDLATILNLFLVYDTFIRQQPSRSPWLHVGYYAGLFMYCLAARLQRIGIRYHQCGFNGNELIQVDTVELPNSIATLIEQYGYVEDEHGFVLIPKVTQDLVLFMHRIGYDLMTAAGNHATLVVRANLDYISFLAEGYSGAHAATYGLCLIANFLGYPAPVTGIAQIDRNNLITYLIEKSCHDVGHVNMTQAQLDVINPWPVAPVLASDTLLFRGGAAPAVNAPITQDFHNAVLAARESVGLGFGNAPFNNGNWQSNALANDVMIPFSDLTYLSEITKMKILFVCRRLNQDTTGTKAPLVQVDNVGVAKPTALMVGTTAQEFFYGCALSNLVVTITPTERFYNVENPARRRLRYVGPPCFSSVAGVRGALIQADLIVRK